MSQGTRGFKKNLSSKDTNLNEKFFASKHQEGFGTETDAHVFKIQKQTASNRRQPKDKREQ